MPRRRSFGSVRKLPSGRWQARYRNRSGMMSPAPKTFATKTEAMNWLTAAEADRLKGSWIDPEGGRVLLEDYCWHWLESKVSLAPRTREIYSPPPPTRTGLPPGSPVRPLAGTRVHQPLVAGATGQVSQGE